MRYQDIRESCARTNKQLPKSGLVDLTFGNLSVLDREQGVFAIKPSGVDYDALRPEDMVIVDLDGKIVEGKLRPSSDTPTHRCLYEYFSEINSVVHTHSRHAVMFAQAAMAIPCLGTTHADYFYGDVPVTRPMSDEEIQGDYEYETGKVIVETFAQTAPLDIPAVLVRNHGPFCWGTTPKKALENAFALEVIAQMALQTRLMNPQAPKTPQALHDKHFKRKHGATAYYGQG